MLGKSKKPENENVAPKLESVLLKDKYTESEMQALRDKLITNEIPISPVQKLSLGQNDGHEMLINLQRKTETRHEGQETIEDVRQKTERIVAGSGETYTAEEREILTKWADGAMNALTGMKKNIRNLLRK